MTIDNLVYTIGKDENTGEPIYGKLSPNLLITGGTATGKTTIICNIVEELISKNSPKELQLIIVDTKGCCLDQFYNAPHLAQPATKDIVSFKEVLDYLTKEVNARYELLKKSKCKSAQNYNQKHPDKMPPIIVVIDEIADIMISIDSIESELVRFFQRYQRASDVHFIIGATTSGTPEKWLTPLMMSCLGMNKIILYSYYAPKTHKMLFPDIYDKLVLNDPGERKGYYFDEYAIEKLKKFKFEL